MKNNKHIQEKKWFEENYLDGDKIQDGQMLSSAYCFEAIQEALLENRQQVYNKGYRAGKKAPRKPVKVDFYKDINKLK